MANKSNKRIKHSANWKWRQRRFQKRKESLLNRAKLLLDHNNRPNAKDALTSMQSSANQDDHLRSTSPIVESISDQDSQIPTLVEVDAPQSHPDPDLHDCNRGLHNKRKFNGGSSFKRASNECKVTATESNSDPSWTVDKNITKEIHDVQNSSESLIPDTSREIHPIEIGTNNGNSGTSLTVSESSSKEMDNEENISELLSTVTSHESHIVENTSAASTRILEPSNDTNIEQSQLVMQPLYCSAKTKLCPTIEHDTAFNTELA